MSSFIFFIISPIMLYLLHPYAKERNLAIHLVWVMMIFVGQFFISLLINQLYQQSVLFLKKEAAKSSEMKETFYSRETGMT